jgi:uncharacterized cupin superfamily protein
MSNTTKIDLTPEYISLSFQPENYPISVKYGDVLSIAGGDYKVWRVDEECLKLYLVIS